MAVLTNPGDEVRGERILCIYRKRGEEILFPHTSGHRAIKVVIKGLPVRAIVDKIWRFKR